MWSDLKIRSRTLFRRAAVDAELDQELQAHFDRQVAKYVRAGATSEEAMRRVRLEFGGMDQVKEECRDARGVTYLETLLRDIRIGLRMLGRSPGFTAVAALTLALGIGANAAIFSAINALLLRPLPIEKIDRLVSVVSLREGFDPFGISLLEYTAYRDRSHSLQGWGLNIQRSFNLVEHGEPERIQGATVQADYLTTLGVRPVLGRAFTQEEDRPGGPAVALMAYGLWQRRFGGDPQMVGRRLNLEGRATTVIGILPPGFDLPIHDEIWVPLQTNIEGLPLAVRDLHEYDLVARLRPGVSLAQADADLKAIARQLELEYPLERRGWGVRIIGLRQQLMDDFAGRVQKSLLALLGAVAFLLFICCANVASLLLARGVAREREIAVRRALGADWRTIARQLLTESSILALLGGAAGLLMAFVLLPLLRVLNPIQTWSGLLGDVRIDRQVLAFVAFITVLTAVICPLIPMAKAVRATDLMSLIKAAGQRGSTGSGGKRWLAALVVAEVAIAVPLLVGGGLMIRSFQRLQHVELGFRPEHLLAMHVDLPRSRYPEFQKRVTFVEHVLNRFRTLPGVESAGITSYMPLSIASRDSMFTVEGRPPVNPSNVPITAHRLVSPSYLQTLGVTLIRGRLLNELDRAGRMPVAVISEEFARQAWPGEDPLGKHVRRGRPQETNFPWITVVGVVRDVKEDRDNFRINRPVWYLPYEQQENAWPLDLVIRASGDAASVTAAVRDAVHAVDPDQPVSHITTMTAHLAGVVLTDRFSAILMGALAALGLTLASVGLYGVMAYSVSRQTGEIGLRVALGARRSAIFRMVIERGVRLIAAGLILGLIGALDLTRFFAGSLYEVQPHDPLTFALVAGVLAVVALAACYVPARRATKVDPLVALRYE